MAGRRCIASRSTDRCARNWCAPHPQVDVDGVVRIGRSRRVVGATFATEMREAVYFDPELSKLATSLAKSLPNLPLIRFVDASADESKLLLWAGSDTDPGRYFVFDKAKQQLKRDHAGAAGA